MVEKIKIAKMKKIIIWETIEKQDHSVFSYKVSENTKPFF